MGMDLSHWERVSDDMGEAFPKIEKLQAEKKRLREALAFALSHLKHAKSCALGASAATGNICTCGLGACIQTLKETA